MCRKNGGKYLNFTVFMTQQFQMYAKKHMQTLFLSLKILVGT
jgi:hypothetical protein